MKVVLLLLMSALAAGCGQKGPLVLPDARTATPVVRAPAADGTTAPASATPAAADKKKRPE